MRVIDESGKTITTYDLSKGFLAPTIAIKEDASPIDNVTKFAWADDDYEKVSMFVLNPIEDTNLSTEFNMEDRLDKLEQLVKKILLDKVVDK